MSGKTAFHYAKEKFRDRFASVVYADFAACRGTVRRRESDGLSVNSMRAAAAKNTLDNKVDIAKVQEWLGHGDISTTRFYHRRAGQPEQQSRTRKPRPVHLRAIADQRVGNPSIVAASTGHIAPEEMSSLATVRF